MAKERITSNSKKPASPALKRRRLEKQTEEWTSEYSIDYAFLDFLVQQQAKGNSKQTLSFYKNFYAKFSHFFEESFNDSPKNTPVDYLTSDIAQAVFMSYLKKQELKQQTINSYLRAYRAFGNFCEKKGYIDGFECPIKEVEPPVKEVYTDKELEKLMVKPPMDDFMEWRTYCIISLILNTGARANTILNIKICDVELDEGYINFNTTKAHKVIRLGLHKKTKLDLTEWINWRYDVGAEETDYLFCNEYGEQMSRSTLTKSIRVYNHRRGIEKTSIHLLRHTFAKRWITSGGDIITLARVLTHSELEMVKRYSNLYGEDVKNEIDEHSAIAQMKTKSGSTLRTKKRKLTDI